MRLCSLELRECKVKKKHSGIFAGGGAIGSELVFSPFVLLEMGIHEVWVFFLIKNPSFVVGGRSLYGGEIMQKLQ